MGWQWRCDEHAATVPVRLNPPSLPLSLSLALSPSLLLSLSPSLQKNDPRVNITQPSDESPYYRILFSDLTTGDGGSYRVQAVNSEGSRYQTVSLSVIGELSHMTFSYM